MRIVWSPTAVSDLRSIREYIARENPAAAHKVAARIKDSINRLVNFPLSGRAGRVAETRELVIPGTSFIAAYTIHGDEVRIAAVLHGKQAWPETFEP
jgi:addiction module RelE/StbE family toxin